VAENEQGGEEDGLDSQAGVMEMRPHVEAQSKLAGLVRSELARVLNCF
jgi:hypothetical protein